MIKDVDKIIEEYKSYAVNHWKASCEGDHKSANRYYTKLTKLYNIFLENDEIKQSALVLLLNDNNYAVQNWASAHCLGLGYMEKEAEDTLIVIVNLTPNEAPSFEAKMTLKVWKEKGTLTF